MTALPNIVLVHGAWADGSSWSAVIEHVQTDGYSVTAPQFPMTRPADDVARLRQVPARQNGLTVVAGRSYGGQIITAHRHAQRRWPGLHRTCSGWMSVGESIGALLAQVPGGPPWRISTSTSAASPSCPRTTSSTTSRPTSTQSRQRSCSRSSSRCTGAPSRR